MKKFLILVVAVILCACAALGIFIATFDANRYGSLVVQKMSDALGQPVHLGRLSLIWKNGIALRLQDLIVYEDAQRKVRALSFKDASATVQLLPLLHKDIQVSSVYLEKPFVHLIRGADGMVRLAGSPGSGATGASGPSSGKSAAGPQFLSVGAFVMTDGRVDLEDLSPTAPMSISVRDLDVKVKNFSLTRPFSFDIGAAILSSKQNLHMSGLLLLPQEDRPGYVEKAVVRTGLADLDLGQLSKVAPAVTSSLEGNLGGKLELQIDHMDLGPDPVKNFKGSIHLQNAAIMPRGLPGPLENIQLDADVTGDDLDLRDFSAKFAKGTLKASGQVKDFRGRTVSNLKIAAQDLSIQELAPASGRNAVQLGGSLSLDFSGSATGASWPAISQTLYGQGRLNLKDGVLFNSNLLRTSLQKISKIPGAEGLLQNLPGYYQAKLGEPNTLFKPVDLPFIIKDGQVLVDRLLVVTDLLTFQGAGQLGFDKSVQANVLLRVNPNLSEELVRIASQAGASRQQGNGLLGGLSDVFSLIYAGIGQLRNTQGEIEIPVSVGGVLPQLSVHPDKDYLMQKIGAPAAQQMVVGTVRNLLDKPAAAGEAGIQDSFKKLLGQAVSGQDNAGGQQQ